METLSLKELHDLNKHLISHRFELVKELSEQDFMTDEMTLEKARNLQNIEKLISKTVKAETLRKRDAENV